MTSTHHNSPSKETGPPITTVSKTALNPRVFAEDRLDVSTCSQEDSEGVKKLQKALSDAGEKAASDLQSHVYKNYPEFVVISKEISQLESDMLCIQGLINDLRDMSGIWRPNEVVDDKLESDDNRISIVSAKEATVESPSKLNKDEAQMQVKKDGLKRLMNQVEGLAQAAATDPPKYIVRDGKSRIWELNLTRQKPNEMVHIYILDNAILVTSWKKNMNTGKTRMVVERYWNLVDIGIVDVKDSADMTNVFKIVHHPDVFMYRSERLDEKKALLASIKKAAEDLVADQRRMNGETYDYTKAMEPKLEEKEAEGKDSIPANVMRWLVDAPVELDVMIAHRDFDTAIEYLEEGSQFFHRLKELPQNLAPIRKAIEERSDVLARAVCAELASPVATRDQVQNNIERLLRLNLGDQARDIFLTARSELIQHRIRQISLSGSMVLYVSELAEVIFRMIRSTCDWYSNSFRSTTMASGFMKWVCKELESFCKIVRRQVFESQQSFTVIAECMQSTLEYCKQLRDVGLDLSFLIDYSFHDDIVKSIENHAKKCEDVIILSITQDNFEARKPDAFFWSSRGIHIKDGIPPLVSQSAYDLHGVLIEFASDVAVLMSLTLYSKIVWCLCTFFVTYISTMHKYFLKRVANKQYVVMLVNCIFVNETILPSVREQLSERFRRPIPELQELQERLNGMVLSMKESYVTQTVERIRGDIFPFESVDYSSSADILDDCLPSEDIMKLLLELNNVGYEMDRMLDKSVIMTDIIERIFDYMLKDVCWLTDNGPRRFGFGGVQQMVLDVHLFLRICEKFVSDKANDDANAVCEKGLRAYFNTEQDLTGELKLGDWYESRVNFFMLQIAELYVGLDVQTLE